MATPLIMLILLTAPYGIVRFLNTVIGRKRDGRIAGAVGLALLFALTGIGHFTDTTSMAQMLPPWVPGRVPLVYATGILELGIALGFLFRLSRRSTGWVAAVLLVLFFRPTSMRRCTTCRRAGTPGDPPIY